MKLDILKLKYLEEKEVQYQHSPKLGPLGLNAKKIGEDIIKESSKMKGIR